MERWLKKFEAARTRRSTGETRAMGENDKSVNITPQTARLSLTTQGVAAIADSPSKVDINDFGGGGASSGRDESSGLIHVEMRDRRGAVRIATLRCWMSCAGSFWGRFKTARMRGARTEGCAPRRAFSISR